MNPRVRFAPSPTGQLHIGGARTALFNFLFSRKNNGQFLVRIEDTDMERSKKEHVDQICDSVEWLGLNWDEELVFQSQRTDVYRSVIDELLESGKAYRCFCSKAELAEIRGKTGSYLYTGIWRDRDPADIKTELEKGTPFTVRLKTSQDGATAFNDTIYGSISVENSELDDFIIARSDFSPVYNLVVVVDDHEMGITHVIRGEDHISNTPKHIQIFQALGWKIPNFAHLPMILGSDKKRLSKRHGAAGVQSYRDEGYQPAALLNYLAFLGWNPNTDEEIMTLDDLIHKFDLGQVNKKAAVFDVKKLNWVSGQHLAMQPGGDILENVRRIEPDWGADKATEYNLSVIELMGIRSTSLKELMEKSVFFYSDPVTYLQDDMDKVWKDDSHETLNAIKSLISDTVDWQASALENCIKKFLTENSLGFGRAMKPLRLALCGMVDGPSLFDVMELLGKESCLLRIDNALSKL